jgi:hypothetical protein
MLPELRTATQLAADLWPEWPEQRRTKWLYRQVEERGMPAIRLGRGLVFDPAAVAAWLQERTTNGGNDEETNGPLQDGPPDN